VSPKSDRLRVWWSSTERSQMRPATSSPALRRNSRTQVSCSAGREATGQSRIGHITCATSPSGRTQAGSERAQVPKSWPPSEMQQSASSGPPAPQTSPRQSLATLPKSDNSSSNWLSSKSKEPWAIAHPARKRAGELVSSIGAGGDARHSPEASWLVGRTGTGRRAGASARATESGPASRVGTSGPGVCDV
jgi:hypothetical protein